MVLEIWNGPAKCCAHRCLLDSGLEDEAIQCDYTLARSHLGEFSTNVALLG
eukprot:COSAG05_NODE_20_length_33177_cov_336.302639_3_plen_51_part_00